MKKKIFYMVFILLCCFIITPSSYAANNNEVKEKILGWWLYCEDPNDSNFCNHAINMQFNHDGTFYIETWITKGYGTYSIISPQEIAVEYDTQVLNQWAGTLEYVSGGRVSTSFSFDGVYIYENETDEYGKNHQYQHMDKLMTINDIEKELANGVTGINTSNILADEVTQVYNYIDNGLFLEAIQLCDDMLLHSYKFSDDDISACTGYKAYAALLYNRYLNCINNGIPWNYDGFNEFFIDAFTNKTYRMYDWGMCYSIPEDITSEIIDRSNGKAVLISPNQNATIEIQSYPRTSNIDEILSNSVTQLRNVFNYDLGFGNNYELLSESYTTVGDMPAKQSTFRYTYYTNRYWTQGKHTIIRITSFVYGDWAYVIISLENSYLWSEKMWDTMEKVRTSIYFS